MNIRTYALVATLLSLGEVVCGQTPITLAPTTAPPTNTPTKKPTASPTKAPTNNPTKKPTAAPTAYLGSSKWYADTANNKLCSKDCATGAADADCDGVNHATATWLKNVYSTAALCCAGQFAYLDGDYCTDRSAATPVGTNKWYADSANGKCVQDNTTSLGPFANGTLFADATKCCSGALAWVNQDFCTTRSAGAYSSKWFVDYTEMICKKDCVVSSGAPECKPLADKSVTLFADAATCCAGKLSWIASSTCASVSTSGVPVAPTTNATNGTAKYYADYDASPARCAKDCATANDPECGGIVTNTAGMQMFDNVSTCCSAKFGWIDQDRCKSLTTNTSTNKWYVDYQSNSCKQDCALAANSPCGGSPSDLSMALFNDAATCCSTKLGWVQANTCQGKSVAGSTASTGTLKYYAAWPSATCKKDCAVATGSPECGGVLNNTVGEALFDNATACCSAKFAWVNKDLCVAMGTSGYSGKFYVDYQSNSCKQDCATGSNNCGGNPSDKSMQLFDTAATCCSTKLSYVNNATCISVSTTGTAPVAAAVAATGSGKWYVDWSISKCVKDCPVSTNATECGGLAESWESTNYTTWEDCCSKKLSWVKSADCHN